MPVTGKVLYVWLSCAAGYAQVAMPKADPGDASLARAYEQLRSRDYDGAIESFREAIAASPGRVAARLDLAYTLLKVGENEGARDQFREVVRLDPANQQAALEYGFLCHETGLTREARLVFDRLRRSGDESVRRTAERAFRNIDEPLGEAIARWRKALEADPGNFSAHLELARLAEKRNEDGLAAEHFEAAWRLRPERRSLLVDMGRVWGRLGRGEESHAALLAASRGAEPRAAEAARALLPERYPFVSEFERALALDADNAPLRRELAYLFLEMGQAERAEEQFGVVVERAPEDLLSAAQLGFLLLRRNETDRATALLQRVLEGGDEELADRVRAALGMPQIRLGQRAAGESGAGVEAKVMAERSLEAGYLKDALKYLEIAHELDPADFSVMLNLGRAYNVLRQDEVAVKWFDLARRSPDPAMASEAERAYRNLRPAVSRLRVTFWAMPFYSRRWKDAFGYAQLKTEVRLGRLPFQPYVSLRFAGDARQTVGSVAPQYLSESSVVFGLGVRTRTWRGLTAWAEAGTDISYLDRSGRAGRMAPDYRGGVSFQRGFGNLLGGESAGGFAETLADGVFMSRFDNTVIGYWQNKFGYTAPVLETLGGLHTQWYWNANLTADSKRQGWANFVEAGPGVRFRWRSMPKSLVLSVELLRGRYLLGENVGGPYYNEVRAGLWYATTK